MTRLRVRTGPIHVEKTLNWKGQVVWAWHCDVHVRCRGFHHVDRWSDHWRRSNGIEPDVHPWARCMDGAIRHWHRYHSACTCAAKLGPHTAVKPARTRNQGSETPHD